MNVKLYTAALTVVVGLVLATPAFAQGATVGPNCTIAWIANAEPDLASYRVYGTLQLPNGVITSKTLDVPKPAVAGATVSTTCLAMGLTTGGALNIQVDAVDTLGNRGPKSVVSANTQDISPPAQPQGLTVTPNP